MTTPSQLKTFNQNTLNDNWYEERAPPLKGVIADYGTTIPKTTNQQSFIRPSKFTGKTAAYKQMQRHNTFNNQDGLRDIVNKTRVKYDSGRSGIGFDQLPAHQAGYGARQLTTSNMINYGVGTKPSNTKTRFMKSTGAPPSGGPGGARKEMGMSTSGMAGEVFKKSAEPQQDTAAQRSWLYDPDPAITVKTSKNSHLPRQVTVLSLPLNNNSKATKPGPRVSTTLTKGSGGVFMDD